MQAEISSVKGYMVTYKQIGLKHILSRAYVCIYIYWLCIDISMFLPIPMASSEVMVFLGRNKLLGVFGKGCLTSMAA